MHINNLIGEVLPPSLTSIPLGYRRESYLQTAIAVRVYKYGSLQSLAHQWLIENLPKNDGVARQKEGVHSSGGVPHPTTLQQLSYSDGGGT